MSVVMAASSVAASSEECLRNHRTFSSQDGWCNATFDSILCWPPTATDTELLQPCPPFKGVDPKKFARRYCLEGGMWRGRTHQETLLGGWTNYSDCFIPEVKKLMDQLYSSSGDDAGKKLTIAWIVRILEMVGLIVSFCCILICLFLFFYFRRLRNSRTRIHIHLFTAILVLVVLRLTLYIDQYITRAGGGADGKERGIDNTPVLCELFYVLQEWARSAVFLWMFLEGYYLHSTLTRDVFNEKPSFVAFSLIGWGLSMLLTSVWAIVMACYYTETQCWWGKHESPLYWIIQGPRFTVIAANLGFLLNILRVLVTKLHESSSNDVQKVRKAVRAALFLLPLLGITHSLEMFEPPLDRSAAVFGCYTIVLAVLDSFQGFYISLLYCFLNQEVRDAVVKQWHDLSLQRQLGCRRPSHIDRKLSCRLLHINSMRADAETAVTRTIPPEDP